MEAVRIEPVKLTPVELSPVELTPVELTPVELTPVKLTPVELTPVEVPLQSLSSDCICRSIPAPADLEDAVAVESSRSLAGSRRERREHAEKASGHPKLIANRRGGGSQCVCADSVGVRGVDDDGARNSRAIAHRCTRSHITARAHSHRALMHWLNIARLSNGCVRGELQSAMASAT